MSASELVISQPVGTSVRKAPSRRPRSSSLRINPLYVASEGRLLAVVDPSEAGATLELLRAHPLGAGAAIIGEVRADPRGLVMLETTVGGSPHRRHARWGSPAADLLTTAECRGAPLSIAASAGRVLRG
jgi:hypothetical protein